MRFDELENVYGIRSEKTLLLIIESVTHVFWLLDELYSWRLIDYLLIGLYMLPQIATPKRSDIYPTLRC